MRTAIAGSFFAYIALFLVLQSIVGRRVGANNKASVYSNVEMARQFIGMVALACLLGAALTMRHDKLNNLVALRYAGFALTALGLTVSIWAQFALGRSWVGGAGIHKRHHLVTSGPFRFVRHPMYSGMWMSGLGLCLVSLNVFYGLTGLLWALSFSVRIPYEEVLLRQKFRRRYDDYASRVGMIIPRIRRIS